MRSGWKGSYLFGGFVREFDGKSFCEIFVSTFQSELISFFNNTFNFFERLNKDYELYFYNRGFTYHIELFEGVVKFFLYNGRHFVALRQIVGAHNYVRFGEMLLTKKLGRRIHLKSMMKKKQRKGLVKK